MGCITPQTGYIHVGLKEGHSVKSELLAKARAALTGWQRGDLAAVGARDLR